MRTEFAVNDGDVDAGFFEYVPVLDQAGDAAAALLALPAIDAEVVPIEFLFIESSHDVLLDLKWQSEA